MQTRSLFLVAGLVALIHLSAQSTRAQDKKPEFTPDVIPSTFRMFLVTDGRFPNLKDEEGKPRKGPDGKELPNPNNRQGKIHCLVCENGLAPMIVAFVRADAKTLGPESGLAKLAKGLDALIPKYRADKLSGFVAFLRTLGGTKAVTVKTTLPDGSQAEQKIEVDLEYPDDEKRGEFVKDIRGLAEALNVPNVPFGLAAEKSKALTDWGINDTDEITVVVYNRMRRVGPAWRFEKAADLTDEKVAEILKATETAINAKR